MVCELELVQTVGPHHLPVGIAEDSLFEARLKFEDILDIRPNSVGKGPESEL